VVKTVFICVIEGVFFGGETIILSNFNLINLFFYIFSECFNLLMLKILF
jgi:hypothetical protein